MSTNDWARREATSADEGGLVYCWLKSFAHSRYGRARNAHLDGTDDERAYWAEHREIVMALLARSDVELLVDPIAPEVFWGFLVSEGDTVHYLLAKRRFHKEGLSVEMFRALLGDRLERPCVYTHELVEFARPEVIASGLVPPPPHVTRFDGIPRAWRFDPYILSRAA